MTDWFKVYNSCKHPKLRLFCFPYAGGSAQIFSEWAASLPESIDLFAVQAPGRGNRFLEKPIACLNTKVKILHAEILPFINTPYMFIGHSNGALLAFELARELQKSGNDNLKHMVVSAKRAPHLIDRTKAIHNLEQKQFLEKLKEYNFTPNEVLDNQELMDLFSPMLRADFSLSETHLFDKSIHLHSNTSLFWGNQDKDVTLNDILAWKDLINGEINLVEFNDGHFFIIKHKKMFLNEINRLILKII